MDQEKVRCVESMDKFVRINVNYCSLCVDNIVDHLPTYTPCKLCFEFVSLKLPLYGCPCSTQPSKAEALKQLHLALELWDDGIHPWQLEDNK